MLYISILFSYLPLRKLCVHVHKHLVSSSKYSPWLLLIRCFMWLLSHRGRDRDRENVQRQASTEQANVRLCFVTPTIGLICLDCIKDLITRGRRMEITRGTGCRGEVMSGDKGNVQDLLMTSKVTDPLVCGLKVQIWCNSPHKPLIHILLLSTTPTFYTNKWC